MLARLPYPLVAVLLLVACSGNDRYRRLDRDEDSLDAGRRDGGRPDAGGRDSGDTITLPDGRVVHPDELLDGSMARDGGDVTVLPDGRVVEGDGGSDGGAVEPDVHACTVGADESFELAVPYVEGGFGIASGPVGFGLATLAAGSCRNAIEFALVDSSSGKVTRYTAMDGCDTVRELALTSAANGWYLAWTGNSTKTIELHASALDDELKLPAVGATPTALTTSSQFERNPALASVVDMPMVAWIGEEGDARTIFTRKLGADAAIEAVPADVGHRPIELELAQIGPEHAAVAWVEEVANRGIWLQALDAAANRVGVPQRLTMFAAPGSTVSLGLHERGGAAVYSPGIDDVNFEVRFHRLWPDGRLRGDEVKVISRPLQAKDAGVAALGGGYAIAYRAIPDGIVIKEPEVRLVFISKDGNLARDATGRVITFPVAPAARDGSRIQVAVSVDGHLLIAFVDGNDAGENKLRVIEKRLDCPL